ncbi:MAG TPA: VOC family protein, partial [Polyangiaceae bacterium]|nr:VOC family protein [Polyangiaceae bacterium]
MSQAGPLGILGIEAIHYYVRNLDRSRQFYTERLDFSEIGAGGEALAKAGRQRSLAFEAGGCRVICSSPAGEGGRADRYLKKHPDGIGSIVFAVGDIERTFSHVEARGGTPVDEVQVTECDTGRFRTFVI